MAAGGWRDWSEASMSMGGVDGGDCEDDVGGWENHERRMTLWWTRQWMMTPLENWRWKWKMVHEEHEM